LAVRWSARSTISAAAFGRASPIFGLLSATPRALAAARDSVVHLLISARSGDAGQQRSVFFMIRTIVVEIATVSPGNLQVEEVGLAILRKPGVTLIAARRPSLRRSSLLRGHVDHHGALADPLLRGHRPVADDVTAGGAVFVVDRYTGVLPGPNLRKGSLPRHFAGVERTRTATMSERCHQIELLRKAHS
jgi:hypothetical protein